MNKLQKSINRLGRELVKCDGKKCKGTWNKPKKGYIPRCLILEMENCKGKKGVIIIGENPGPAKGKEKRKLQNASYKKYLEFWKEGKRGYYEKLRKFARNAGVKGPILWTDIVKCQKPQKKSKLPAQTIRNCIQKYLIREIDLAPKNWPIITNGKTAFNAASYLFLDRLVIGIPHATGSRIFNKRHKQILKFAKKEMHKKSKAVYYH